MVVNYILTSPMIELGLITHILMGDSMSEVQATNHMIKKMIELRGELANWAKISRESRISDNEQRWMMIRSLEIDELLREIGADRIEEVKNNSGFRAIVNV